MNQLRIEEITAAMRQIAHRARREAERAEAEATAIRYEAIMRRVGQGGLLYLGRVEEDDE